MQSYSLVFDEGEDGRPLGSARSARLSESRTPRSKLSVDSEVCSSSSSECDDEEEISRVEMARDTLEHILLQDLSMGCGLSKTTVYGAAVAMPQIARSSGWSKVLTVLAMRTYFFLLMNYVLQGFFVYSLYMEQYIMNRYAGQMNLCDFGKNVMNCPWGEGCTGPAGTKYTPNRMYSWEAWSIRRYVKESLLVMFPELHAEIENKVDPGEYGLDNYYCRFACCFVYILSVMEDLFSILRNILLLYHVPTKAQSWISFRGELNGEAPIPHLNDIQVKVAGIPLCWKLINICVVILPRMLLWKLLAESGIVFLMESDGISEVIVNAVALAFILNVAGMIFEEFTARATRTLMKNLQDYKIPAKRTIEKQKDLANNVADEDRWLHTNWDLLPLRFISTMLITVIFIYDYYLRHCTWEEGMWISKPVSLPIYNAGYLILCTAFPRFFPIEHQEAPYWSMPEE